MGVIGELLKGLRVTGSQMFKPRVTVKYPAVFREKPERFHGRHVLNRYPDGMEKCIGCELCAGACPARCIYVRGADNPVDDPVSPGERYGFVYEINMLRCIFCGMCEEACPTGAVVLGHEFELADFKYQDFVYGKDDMLVGVTGGKWQRREAAKKGTEVRLGFTAGHRPELEGVEEG